MAEEDGTEGRCPACCTPYDKEKLVAEVSVDRKKSQTARSKPCKVRQLLGSVRVIQWNVVHNVGLPLTMADEDLLQRKDYFGLYGRFQRFLCRRLLLIYYILKRGRSSSLYSVRRWIYFGWERVEPCNIPKCLYLHEVGLQEDIHAKDEVAFVYMRTRVQQITGVTINMQRRSGYGLPSPVDGYGSDTYASSANPAAKALQIHVVERDERHGRCMADGCGWFLMLGGCRGNV
ncbi:hypothetical protein Droror1_Dr00002930 [Drosera rotundifolia]